MMKMLNNAIADAFKSVFVSNNFDGSEDFLLSDKIYNLVGTEMVKFKEDSLNSVPPKNVKELMKTITPPKGVKRRMPSKGEHPVDEGYDIFDGYDYDKITVTDDIVGEYSDDDTEVVGSQEDQAGTSTTQDSTSEPVKGRPLYPQRWYVEMITFAEDCNDVDIIMDAKFLDNIAKTLDENEYSPTMKSFAFQMQATLRKSRRNLKSRISSNKAQQNVENNDNDNDGEEERGNVSATNEHGRHVCYDWPNR